MQFDLLVGKCDHLRRNDMVSFSLGQKSSSETSATRSARKCDTCQGTSSSSTCHLPSCSFILFLNDSCCLLLL